MSFRWKPAREAVDIQRAALLVRELKGRLGRLAVRSAATLVALSIVAGSTFGQGLIETTEQVANEIADAIAQAGYDSVAVVDPVDASNVPTVFGRFLAEELSGALVNLSTLRVVDRLSLQRILEEQQLSISGLVDDADAVQRIGDIAGVQVLVLGTYFVLGDTVRLSIKGLDVRSAEAVAAVNVSLEADAAVQGLLGSGVVNAPLPPSGGHQASADGLVVAEMSSNASFDPATGSFYMHSVYEQGGFVTFVPPSSGSRISFEADFSYNLADVDVEIAVDGRTAYRNLTLGRMSVDTFIGEFGPSSQITLSFDTDSLGSGRQLEVRGVEFQ